MKPLRTKLFGPMQIWRGEVAITHFKTRTERALLAYLLLNAGQPLSRRLVASLLWPESEEGAALKSLRVVLTRLRQTIGEAEENLIIANHTQLWFNPAANYSLDVYDFEEAVQWVHTLPTTEQLLRPEAIQHTRQAITLYSGDLLAGFDSGSDLFDDWLATRRGELQQMAVWAAALAIRQAEQQGDYSLMEQWSRRLIHWEPWHEEAHQWLMQALQAQGQRQAALLHIDNIFGQLTPTNHPANWAQAHLVRGDIQQKDGYPGRAKADFQAALTLAKQANHLRLQIETLGRLTYFMTQTVAYNERAVSLANETGDRWLQWRAINLLAISEANAGRYERAYRYFAQLLYLDSTLEMAHYRQVSLFNNLGTILQLLGDYERALIHFERGLRLAEMLADQNGYAQAHLGISGACRKLGDFERAMASAEAAAQTLLKQGSQANKLFAYLELGQAQLALGATEAAQTAFTTALEIAELIGLTMFSLLSRASLIELLLKQGKDEIAASHADFVCLVLQSEKPNPTLHPLYIQWQTIRALQQVGDPRMAQLVQTGCAFLQQTAAQIEDRHLRHLYLNRIDVHHQLAHLGGIG